MMVCSLAAVMVFSKMRVGPPGLEMVDGSVAYERIS